MYEQLHEPGNKSINSQVSLLYRNIRQPPSMHATKRQDWILVVNECLEL